MRRSFIRTISVVAFLLAGLLASSLGVIALAQDATPPAGPITVNEVAPGVTAEVLAAAPSVLAPGQTAYTVRFIFQGGSDIFPHGHPGTTVLGVLSGSFGWTLVEGTAYVVRGAGSGGTAVETLSAPGTDVILAPGDAIYYESDVIHTARGIGDEPAVVMGSLILEAGAPLLMPADMDMSTPSS